MSEKQEYFIVTIAIFEGRHFIWLNMDSAVYVTVDSQKKCTNISRNTDCPFFNEYFTFEFTTTLDNLLYKTINLTVIKPSTVWTSRKVLGSITLDIGTVWRQPHHQFYQKWAILSPPLSESGGIVCGYLKVDINIQRKGRPPKIPHVVDTDDIEKNLLVPHGFAFDRQRANYVFNIYRGDNLCKDKEKSTNLVGNLSNKDVPSSYVEVLFAGLKAQTSIKKNNSNPEWNESLILTELFPPLYHGIKIKLHFVETLQNIVLEHDINIRSISNAGENGFLPTFGPTFVHFYLKRKTHETLMGKILMSISTQLQVNELNIRSFTKLEQISGFSGSNLWKNEPLLLFGVIFEANLINKKYSDNTISFEVNFGNASKRIGSSKTLVKSPVTTDKKYWYLNYGNCKPCVFVNTSGFDFRRRLYNSNIVLKMIRKTRKTFKQIQTALEKSKSFNSENNVNAMILEILDFISTSCSKYQDIVKQEPYDYETELDKLWKAFCLGEMDNIKKEISLNSTKRSPPTANLDLLNDLLSRLELLCDDAQCCWPNVYITMLHGNKKVGYLKFNPQDIIYSVVKEECGKYCAKIQRQLLHFDHPTTLALYSTVGCHLDVSLWLGLERHKETCMKSLPQGFEFSTNQTEEKLPVCLISKETHCNAYFYQGKVLPGLDRSGLSDAFVRATIINKTRDTEVIENSLNPIWNQILVFKNLPVYGTKSHIKTHPPLIIIEVYDRDRFNKIEFIGGCMFTPAIKFKEDPYSAPFFPPQLLWYDVHNAEFGAGEILATAELLEQSANEETDLKQNKVIKIPEEITPELTHYRLEVVFWGLRNLQKASVCPITRAKVVMECGDVSLNSDTLGNLQKNLNFLKSVHYIDMRLPVKDIYAPIICIKMYDCKSFGRNILAGSHTLKLQNVFYKPLTEAERLTKILSQFNKKKSTYSVPNIDKKKKTSKKKVEVKSEASEEFMEVVDEKDYDWWTKYYASTEVKKRDQNDQVHSKYCLLKVYPNELELQNEFSEFTDVLQSFELYKGKRSGDEAIDSANITGSFKGALKLYKWPLKNDREYVTENGLPLSNGIFQNFPSNEPFKFLVRVYCVRGLNLRPMDISGKSDPYIIITMDDKVINDRKNYISKQVHPIFGKCFELTGDFSQNHSITIAIWDYDVGFTDDLIGETKIDLENRFYSKHRAKCGLPSQYHETGYCAWRDYEKPSKILANLCIYNRINLPIFHDNFIELAGQAYYYLPPDQTATAPSSNEKPSGVSKEQLALTALHNWKMVPLLGCALVPEHVETRSLYNPIMLGVEQGKIQLWIDIFPHGNFPIPPMVKIKPRQAVEYELRVIIWNTEDVILDEADLLAGQKVSDIYITGWLTNPEEAQSTDIHYRSLTGEGYFNWRFIFRFKYLSTENKIVILKKANVFSLDETEYKFPCRLNIQVWDSDFISADDFLGNLNVELARLPRGAKTHQLCSLKNLLPEAPRINLFKVKRTRGWWPFTGYDKETKKIILAGKLEAEFELLTTEEADKKPAGLNREPPQPLPPPDRPETSFVALWHPLKTLQLLLKRHRWKLFKLISLVLLIVFIILFLHSMSKAYIKKILHL